MLPGFSMSGDEQGGGQGRNIILVSNVLHLRDIKMMKGGETMN